MNRRSFLSGIALAPVAAGVSTSGAFPSEDAQTFVYTGQFVLPNEVVNVELWGGGGGASSDSIVWIQGAGRLPAQSEVLRVVVHPAEG